MGIKGAVTKQPHLSAPKNKKHQENIRLYKSKCLGVSYILKGLQLECGKTAFCYSPFCLAIAK